MNNSRALIVIIFFFVFFGVLVVKLVDIQIVRSEELKYYAKKQQTKLQTIKAERGLIYDRNNLLLVYNRTDVDYYADLKKVPDELKEKLAERFSSVFGKSKSHYLNLLSGKEKTILLEKNVPPELADELKDFKVDGLYTNPKPKRVYQYGRLASHVLGYVNGEYKGVNGIAKAYDDDLNGEDGMRLVETDAQNRIISVAEDQTVEPVPGFNLTLTIDKDYQAILEEELRKGVDKYKGESGIGIIMDPNTGEILALANVSDFDPNEYWKYSDYQRRNRAVTDTYEPGSTFKAFTLATLLDKGLVKENELVFVENGTYKFKNTYIRDTHKNTYLTVAGVIEESSNIGIAKLVQKIDDDTFYKYLRGFGFGTYTSIPLPGEAKGVLKKPNRWSKISKAYISFGYEISVTPVQLITAYAALINGGVLLEPHIVKRETDKNGNVVYESETVPVRRVISANTSLRMRKLLRGVVKKGTGRLANLNIVSVGGKTGTTQLLINGKYSKSNYNASFVGFFPAENPQLVCLIIVNSPKVDKYGGRVAAPIFREVAKRIVTLDKNKFLEQTPVTEPYFENKLAMIGDKESVKQVNYKTASKDESDIPFDGKMPDLRGKSIKDALVMMNLLGLKYDIKGSGVVTYQSIKPGVKINKNQLCEIYCSESSIKGVTIY